MGNYQLNPFNRRPTLSRAHITFETKMVEMTKESEETKTLISDFEIMVNKSPDMITNELVPFLRDWKLLSLNKNIRSVFTKRIKVILNSFQYDSKKFLGFD